MGVCTFMPIMKFKNTRLETCTQILIVKSSIDLCHNCHQHSLTNSGNLTKEEKTEVLAKYQYHSDKLQMQSSHVFIGSSMRMQRQTVIT
jgi:hypothetical protein